MTQTASRPQKLGMPAPESGNGPAAARQTSTRPHSRQRVSNLLADFDVVRARSVGLCAHLEPEDLVAQSMDDSSPAKWHLAHTTWFFETFVMERFSEKFEPFHPTFRTLFNSYYNAVGARHARPMRGVLTRPTLSEVLSYRAHIDEAIAMLIGNDAVPLDDQMLDLIQIGLHHEQQHQELILTDLKHLFSLNALEPSYREPLPIESHSEAPELEWLEFEAGVREIGVGGPSTLDELDVWVDDTRFAFDNEGPRHRIFLEAHALADRLVTNAEYLAFIEDGGYTRSEFWLDRGWSTVQAEGWRHPLYWRDCDGGFREFTLAGSRDFAPHEPVSHISLFEADAFARWTGGRLPGEAEWECAAAALGACSTLADSNRFHPAAHGPGTAATPQLHQAYGDVWEWTSSSYGPYPGYRPGDGALGEYNGKFMCEQSVLRGGSCATSQSHVRPSYRNFFYAPDRWQFSGLRLARDLR